jgi:hypothetical protein
MIGTPGIFLTARCQYCADVKVAEDLLTPPLKIAIVGRYDIYLMLHDPINNTVIGIRAAVIAS